MDKKLGAISNRPPPHRDSIIELCRETQEKVRQTRDLLDQKNCVDKLKKILIGHIDNSVPPLPKLAIQPEISP